MGGKASFQCPFGNIQQPFFYSILCYPLLFQIEFYSVRRPDGNA